MPYDGPIIDIDVHHTWTSPADLYPYLDPWARELVEGNGAPGVPIDPAIPMFPHTHGLNKRVDALPPSGGPAGSDPDLMRAQHLDAFDIQNALITYDIGLNTGVPNPYLAHELARAANRWNLDTWLGAGDRDERLLGALLVQTSLPDEAVAEIRELGTDERFSAVLLVANGLGRPFGHPIYHPIYEAAAELDLPIVLHPGGDQLPGGTQMTAGGMPGSRMEFNTVATQSLMTHLASMITHGAFEKYPKLRYVFLEIGVAWIPALMWRLEQVYDLLRRESRWVRKRPSEYVLDHVKIGTQPLDMSHDRDHLIDVLEGFDGIDEVLVYASDYPHWDADDPQYIARRLKREWWDKVFYENARGVLRMPALATSGRS